MDEVTQGNAASAEESAAASEELSAQATVLHELVESLKAVVDGGTEVGTARTSGRPTPTRGGVGSSLPRQAHPSTVLTLDEFEEAENLIEV